MEEICVSARRCLLFSGYLSVDFVSSEEKSSEFPFEEGLGAAHGCDHCDHLAEEIRSCLPALGKFCAREDQVIPFFLFLWQIHETQSWREGEERA